MVGCGGGWRALTTDVPLGTSDVHSDRSCSVRLRDGGALRSLGWPQPRAPRRDQRAPVLNMFPPSDIHDRRRPSIKIWVDGLFGSSCPILGHLVRDRRAPPSRRHTDHDRPEWTSPVPSGTSVVDARHPPPQMTMANSRAISCRLWVFEGKSKIGAASSCCLRADREFQTCGRKPQQKPPEP